MLRLPALLAAQQAAATVSAVVQLWSDVLVRCSRICVQKFSDDMDVMREFAKDSMSDTLWALIQQDLENLAAKSTPPSAPQAGGRACVSLLL